MMADRPILFSGPMVRALLDGTKTQTRRAINPQPKLSPHHEPVRAERRGDRGWVWMVHTNRPAYQFATGAWKSRYAVGDRLYVREHWRCEARFDEIAPRDMSPDIPLYYAADPDPRDSEPGCAGRFRQGMHMPRWASRLTLTVTDVRVERLQDISRDDAMDEGIVQTWGDFMGDPPEWAFASINRHGDASGPHIYDNRTSVENYRELWNHINGPGSWDTNPWVAAYTFTVQMGNIDQLAQAA